MLMLTNADSIWWAIKQGTMLESIKHVCILLLIEIACIESYLNTVDSKCAKERPNLFEK